MVLIVDVCISCCNGEKITMSIAYLQKNIIFAVAMLTRSRAANPNLLIMRYIAYLLQNRIGGTVKFRLFRP